MESHVILDEYRAGDPDKRMSLFLYYRELRDAFAEIEKDTPMDIFSPSRTAEQRTPGMVHWFLFLLHPRSWRLITRASMDRTGH